MSQLVKDCFTRLLDSAIVVVGTRDIVPAMVFSKIGRYSAYIKHYYMHTPRTDDLNCGAYFQTTE